MAAGPVAQGGWVWGLRVGVLGFRAFRVFREFWGVLGIVGFKGFKGSRVLGLGVQNFRGLVALLGLGKPCCLGRTP